MNQNIHDLLSFDEIKISLASPEEILSWSHGEVIKPETINYRTFKPEKGGIFCEQIFGPTRDYECYCGKYKRIRFKGVICDKCGVEVTQKRVRRERLGHIKLAAPVAHPWFFRNIPSKIALLLEMSPRSVESVIYFSAFMVVDINIDKKAVVISNLEKELSKKREELRREAETEAEKIISAAESAAKKIDIKDKPQKELVGNELVLKAKKQAAAIRESLVAKQDKIEKEFKRLEDSLEGVDYLSTLTDNEYAKIADFVDQFAKVMTGAAAVEAALKKLDLTEVVKDLRAKIETAGGQKLLRLTKRLRTVEGFRRAKIDPTWMIMSVLPVTPPDLRPMVQLDGGRFATSDLNDLYRRVLNRNNRLKRLIDLGAPDIIIGNEKRMLQEAVDSLLDSPRVQSRAASRRGRKEERSLSDMLRGKQGRFRLNLLGKRVDYSGRSVIVVGPELKFNECGLPKEMALELFKPFVLREIMLRGLSPNIKSAKNFLDSREAVVWDILEEITTNYPVLLNRAPTLWRLGVQAFYPKLISGNAIQLHPCVCPGFNADFDGDQMAVHIPLSDNDKSEASNIMLSGLNILRPSSGEIIHGPTRDMVFGVYYLTSFDEKLPEYKSVLSPEEALLAYGTGKLSLRQVVGIRLNSETVKTSVGRLILNKQLPESLGFKNQSFDRKFIDAVVQEVLDNLGRAEATKTIDAFKNLGFAYGTKSGVSLAISDFRISEDKKDFIIRGVEKVAEIERNYHRGLITAAEKTRHSIEIWKGITDEVEKVAWDSLADGSTVKTMINSGGVKATKSQLKQICGMLGLVTTPTGEIVEMPVLSSYVEGLSTSEYFSSSRGTRKVLTDKALLTADAGYLTRRLVDVAQDVIVREEDCGTSEGFTVRRDDETFLASFGDRLVGRYLAKDAKEGNKIIASADTIIDRKIADAISASKIEEVVVRSPLTCKAEHGICVKCYGRDLLTGDEVPVGAAVGVMAAQAIGEPGTQLTLKTFHTGGIVGVKDITQGIPRVDEVFEVRTPRSAAVMSEIAGKVEVVDDASGRQIIIHNINKSEPDTVYQLPPVAEIVVKNGDLVAPGTPLTSGYMDLRDMLAVTGATATERYIINEIQRVYSTQGVLLNDKHIEVIVRQMFNKVQVETIGDTDLLPGEIVNRADFELSNKRVLAAGGTPAVGRIIILGITKSALETSSFLAAASFMTTLNVLTDAAASGRVDRLLGLKENVIIGRLIPTGDRARIK